MSIKNNNAIVIWIHIGRKNNQLSRQALQSIAMFALWIPQLSSPITITKTWRNCHNSILSKQSGKIVGNLYIYFKTNIKYFTKLISIKTRTIYKRSVSSCFVKQHWFSCTSFYSYVSRRHRRQTWRQVSVHISSFCFFRKLKYHFAQF